ncbi:MAG TPA: hypothetical protein VI112_02675 [Bacteroidia bacterium]|jgi:hypothetical protein
MEKQLLLTDEQYRDLAALLLIGNAIVSGEQGAEGMEELSGYILSQAERFNARDLVDKKFDRPCPTEKLDAVVQPFLDNYHALIRSQE